MPLYDLSEFFSLSRAINYNLSATTSGRFYMLKYITDTKHLSSVETGILMKAMHFLINAYGDKRRRLGPPAVLHPLRTATLFSRASNRLLVLDILAAMFHDVFEDIYPFDVDNPQWRQIMLEEFSAMLGRLDNDAGQILFDRLILLCRRDDESYYQYIGRILDEPDHADPALRVKLADRLDNTLDMRIDLSDIPEEQGFFQETFETLFLNVPVRSPLPQVHPPLPRLTAHGVFTSFSRARFCSPSSASTATSPLRGGITSFSTPSPWQAGMRPSAYSPTSTTSTARASATYDP